MSYVFLALAILFEVIATSALQASAQFTRLVPSIVTVTGYAAAFYMLALSLKVIPVGIAYAIWSGVGMVLISLIGIFYFRQTLDAPAVGGIALIVTGVIVINAFSGSVRA